MRGHGPADSDMQAKKRNFKEKRKKEKEIQQVNYIPANNLILEFFHCGEKYVI